MSAFKYRSLTDLKRVLDIIVNKRLYGAKYLSLNDPMEGQFQFNLNEDFTQENLQKLFDARAKARICSLSRKLDDNEIPNNGILWSMYADEHRGCCIEVIADDSNWHKEDVYYSKFPPIVNNTSVKLSDILSIKFNQWDYEKEVRYINTDPKTPYMKVKIKAVYLGCRVDKEDVEFYTSLIKSIDKKITVRQIKRDELNWIR
ncbi:MAG: hypothetical protein K2K98_06465 [Muribaculaceae bacterium]|nr:hypothetical protein [Muribaculaceae bacterium]